MTRNLFPYLFFIALTGLIIFSCNNNAETTRDEGDTTGVTDTEIVIGSWGPMTGPAALWGNILKGMDDCFNWLINDTWFLLDRRIACL